MEKVTIDVPMPISYLRRELVEQMELLQPFGKGNEKPVFAQKGLIPLNCRIFGKNRNVAKLQLRDENGYCMDAVYFGAAQEFADYAAAHERLSVVYYPSIHSWQGRESLQLTIQYYQ